MSDGDVVATSVAAFAFYTALAATSVAGAYYGFPEMTLVWMLALLMRFDVEGV